jgi:hypothetical protein
MSSYDFDYYEGHDLPLPIKPIKPNLGRKHASFEARAYADALEEYERELESYKENLDWYNSNKRARYTELQTKLCNDYDITVGQFTILWNKAQDQGHSEGLNRVVQLFDEFYDMATEFASLEG